MHCNYYNLDVAGHGEIVVLFYESITFFRYQIYSH